MERFQLLAPFYPGSLQPALGERHKLLSGKDDILDAFAALWTAERIYIGIAVKIPSLTFLDSQELPMPINY